MIPDGVKRLEKKLCRAQHMTVEETIDVRNELAWELGYSDLARVRELSRQAYEDAEKLGYKFGLAFGLLNLGFCEYTKPDFAAALKQCNTALRLFVELGDLDQQGNSLSILGLVYWSLGNFDLAFEKLHRSEDIFRTTTNMSRLPWTLTTLAGIYQTVGDYQKALQVHKESLALFERCESSLGKARALNGIGMVYHRLKNYQEALQFHHRSLALFEELRSDIGISRSYNDIGLIYQDLGDLETSLSYHRKSLRLREKLNNKDIELTSLLNLGGLYVQMDRLGEALETLLKALRFAEKFDSKPKLYRVHQVLAEVYERRGDLKSALRHFKAYQEVKEDVFNNEMNTKLKNAEIQHEIERSEKEAEIYRLRNIELKQAMETLRETQVELVESGKMAVLGQVTAGIAHEINNPLGAVKSSADISKRGLKKLEQLLHTTTSVEALWQSDPYQKTVAILARNFETIETAVERIANIVNSLKNFTRLDEAHFKKADIHKGIDSTLALLNHQLTGSVEIIRRYGEIPKISHYPYQMNQVFMTLLRNASQAVGKNGRIVITTSDHSDHIRISIADNGKGLSKERRKSLFGLDFNTTSSRVGFGMGLYNVSTIIKRHGGTIEVDSREGEGTEFVMTLPKA